MKLLTVTIPSYNAEDYMENAVKSLLGSRDDVEIIIVDDGSTDRTGAIGDALEEKYPDVIRCIHQENGGHGEAVNTGIRYATGQYFKVLDSDDWFDPDALKQVIRTLKSFEADELDMMISEDPSILKDWDDEVGDRTVKLVFIGKNMNKEAIIQELNNCID